MSEAQQGCAPTASDRAQECALPSVAKSMPVRRATHVESVTRVSWTQSTGQQEALYLLLLSRPLCGHLICCSLGKGIAQHIGSTPVYSQACRGTWREVGQGLGIGDDLLG